MDRLTAMALFVQVVEKGSLSLAAEALGLPLSTASRGLAGLESRLNARLVKRLPRSMTPTEVGMGFYERCKHVLMEAEAAEAAVHSASKVVSGTLRITSSLSFCLTHISPLLGAFRAAYPKIQLEIVAANRYYDIVDSGTDIAFRTRGYDNDANIHLRLLAKARFVLVASPAYLQRHGEPIRVSELAEHEVVAYSYTQDLEEVSFTRAGKTQRVRVKRTIEANDAQIIRTAAINGLGMAIQPSFVVHEDVASGRLVTVLDAWRLPEIPIYLAYQKHRYLPNKTRAFIDFIVDHFQKTDYETLWTEAASARGGSAKLV